MYITIMKYADGKVYTTFDTKKHYKNCLKNGDSSFNGFRRLSYQEARQILDNECDMSDFPENSYIMVKFKENKQK